MNINSTIKSIACDTKLRCVLLVPFFCFSIVYATDTHPTTRNSVTTFITNMPVSTAADLSIQNSKVQVQYLDGLGRPTLMVQKSIKQGYDLVTLNAYNELGELSSQWLPTPMSTSTGVPNVASVKTDASSFYGDTNPYSSITTDYSLGQINTFLLPGSKWHTANKSIIQQIVSSNEYGNLKRYVVVGDTLKLCDGDGDLATVIEIITDEDGCEKYVYKDMTNNRVLMQRTISQSGINHDTYYVYNDMGQLCFVLSPEATARMNTPGTTYNVGGANTENNPLSQYAYVYQYNAKGQCVAKKLPGKNWIYMVYDQGGRLAFSQDGNQRLGRSSVWTFYRYDALGRLAQSGTSQYDPESPPNYDSQSALATYNTGTGYSSTAPLGTNTKVLTQNFYDSYDFINLGYSSPAQKTNLAYVAQTGTNETKDWNIRYSNPIDGSDIATRGQLTGTYVAELKSSGSIITARYYNNRGQVIQSKSNNHMNGFDNDYFTYNFAGQMLTNKHMHTGPNPAITETYSYRYNKAAQLTSISQKVNTQITVQIDSLEYDDLGRVSRKLIHGCMHATSYAYNIHNQLKSINSLRFSELINYEEDDADGHPAFNGNIASVSYGAGSTYKYKYRYTYDGMNRLTEAKYFDLVTPTNKATYNEMFDSYDLNGNVKALTRSGLVKDFKNMVGTTPDIVAHNMDQLTLTYAGNQLTAVADANKVQEFAPLGNNDFKDKQSATQPTEYFYDANGNQTGDYNKDVAWTKYNMLNLPEKIQFRHGNKTEYTYYADGTKHQALYSMSMNSENIPMAGTAYGEEIENNNISSTFKVDYCGRYIYENNVLVRILTPEGYMVRTTPSSAWTYFYTLKDHLGNTHVSLQSNTLTYYSAKSYFVRGTTEYYPSGMEIMPTATNSSGTNPYLYAGNELDRMNALNQYDFSARWYDYGIAAFTTPDPHAENHYSESPYAYCGGNPINRVDPTGMDWYETGGTRPEFIKDFSENIYYKTGIEGAKIPCRKIGPVVYRKIDGKYLYGNSSGVWEEVVFSVQVLPLKSSTAYLDVSLAIDKSVPSLSNLLGNLGNNPTTSSNSSMGSPTIAAPNNSPMSSGTNSTFMYSSGGGNGSSNAGGNGGSFVASLGLATMTLAPGWESSTSVPIWGQVAMGVLTLGYAAFLYVDRGNSNYPGPRHYTVPDPTGNVPFNNPPKGSDPNEMPPGIGKAAKWAIGGRLLYELYDEYDQKINNIVIPYIAPKDNTTVVQPQLIPLK